MVKKVAPGFCFCLAFVTLACTSLAAQAPQIALSQRSQIVRPASRAVSGLKVIHSNLGPKTDTFDDGISWDITGPGNPQWALGTLPCLLPQKQIPRPRKF
jgi:hypothetical protein